MGTFWFERCQTQEKVQTWNAPLPTIQSLWDYGKSLKSQLPYNNFEEKIHQKQLLNQGSKAVSINEKIKSLRQSTSTHAVRIIG